MRSEGPRLPAISGRRWWSSRRLMTASVVLVVLAITGALMWLAWSADHRSITSRLDLETRQVAATLSAALPSLQTQLDDALNVAAATKSPADFKRFVMGQRSDGKSLFVSESLWVRTTDGAQVLANVGRPLQLVRDGGGSAYFRSLHSGGTLSMTGILPGSPRRLGYAEARTGAGGYVIYAESLLPADTRLTIPASSPFSNLNYAVYIGKSQTAANLVEASTATPIMTTHSLASIPLGNTFITVVATPRGDLAPGALNALPWVILGVGLALAVASATVVDHLSRRRQSAEDLNENLGQLYTEQRTIAETLQHALLPERLPAIETVDIAARYLPGAKGTDVGGDWYDVIPVNSHLFMFVIGDVSGRGVRAAAVMASLRFASRGFALQGNPPATVLEHLAKTLDFPTDGHFATVLCGLADTARHELTLANAGHLPPLLRRNGSAEVLRVPAAPPIGILNPADDIESLVVSTPAGSLFVGYTDGLIERRGEDIETSIKRLRVAVEKDAPSADRLLDDLLAEFTGDAVEDDTAVIALKWLR